MFLTALFSGCRATLHDSIAKFMEEKYPEIEEEIKKHDDSEAILSDVNKQMKVFVKVCFDGTSAPMKSSKGASRLAPSNWLRGTFGVVGVEILYNVGNDTIGEDEVREGDEEGATVAGQEELEITLGEVASMKMETLSLVLDMLPENLSEMKIKDVLSKSSTR